MHDVSETALYAPLDTLKPVAPDIWVIDGPHISFYGLPFSTRSTVVRLPHGGLWVHSPIRWTDALRAQLDALGPVTDLVAPNWIHYAGLPGWQAEYPDAVTWAAPGVAERAAQYKVPLGPSEPLNGAPSPENWGGALETRLAAGSKLHREVVFFHKESRTLILTDLIENFEMRRMPFWARPLLWMAGNVDPDGKMPIDMRFSFRQGRAELRAVVEEMIGWAPERVILAHGRWYEENGADELRRAFRWVL